MRVRPQMDPALSNGSPFGIDYTAPPVPGNHGMTPLPPPPPFQGYGSYPMMPSHSPTGLAVPGGFGPGTAEELTAMRERCRQLEDEVLKLKTERDTIRDLFRIQANANGDASMPTIDPILLGANPGERPSPESHPHIKFWTRMQFQEWQESPEGHANVRGLVPYLEQENGDPVNETTLVEIRRTMRSAWAELRRRDLAPLSWGKAVHSGRRFFHQLVENAHPLFRFAEAGWKLERLATASYSGWTRTYLQQDESTSEGAENQRKRKGKTTSFKTSVKRIKGEESNGASMTTSSSESSCEPMEVDSEMSPISPTSTTMSFLLAESSSTKETDCIIEIVDPLSDLYLEDGSHQDAILKVSSENACTTSESTDSASNSVPEVAHGPTTAPKVSVIQDIPIASDSDVATRKACSINPITAIQDTTSEPNSAPIPSSTTDPVAAVAHTTTTSLSAAVESIAKSSPMTVANSSAVLAESSDPLVNQSTPGSFTSTKMRPGKAKNGRNLCGHRWLQQFRGRSGCGTTQEFQAYWSTLSKEIQRRYEDEAHTLATTNAWGKAELEKSLY